MTTFNCPACDAALVLTPVKIATGDEPAAPEISPPPPAAPEAPSFVPSQLAVSEPAPAASRPMRRIEPGPGPEGESAAARRLRALAQLLEEWIAGGGSWHGFRPSAEILDDFLRWWESQNGQPGMESWLTKNLVSKALGQIGGDFVKRKEGRVYSVPARLAPEGAPPASSDEFVERDVVPAGIVLHPPAPALEPATVDWSIALSDGESGDAEAAEDRFWASLPEGGAVVSPIRVLPPNADEDRTTWTAAARVQLPAVAAQPSWDPADGPVSPGEDPAAVSREAYFEDNRVVTGPAAEELARAVAELPQPVSVADVETVEAFAAELESGLVVLVSEAAPLSAPGAMPEWRLVVRAPGGFPPALLCDEVFDRELQACRPGSRRLGSVAIREAVALTYDDAYTLTAGFTERPLVPKPRHLEAVPAWQPIAPADAARIPEDLPGELAAGRAEFSPAPAVRFDVLKAGRIARSAPGAPQQWRVLVRPSGEGLQDPEVAERIFDGSLPTGARRLGSVAVDETVIGSGEWALVGAFTDWPEESGPAAGEDAPYSEDDRALDEEAAVERARFLEERAALPAATHDAGCSPELHVPGVDACTRPAPAPGGPSDLLARRRAAAAAQQATLPAPFLWSGLDDSDWAE